MIAWADVTGELDENRVPEALKTTECPLGILFHFCDQAFRCSAGDQK
jgi:hypothetical protein